MIGKRALFVNILAMFWQNKDQVMVSPGKGFYGRMSSLLKGGMSF